MHLDIDPNAGKGGGEILVLLSRRISALDIKVEATRGGKHSYAAL